MTPTRTLIIDDEMVRRFCDYLHANEGCEYRAALEAALEPYLERRKSERRAGICTSSPVAPKAEVPTGGDGVGWTRTHHIHVRKDDGFLGARTHRRASDPTPKGIDTGNSARAHQDKPITLAEARKRYAAAKAANIPVSEGMRGAGACAIAAAANKANLLWHELLLVEIVEIAYRAMESKRREEQGEHCST